jgi:hypothetical protein
MAKLKKETVDFINKNKKFNVPLNQKKDSMREDKSIPKDNEIFEWLKHKVKQDQTPQTMAAENKKMTKPIVNAVRTASALGQFSPEPVSKYASMALNSGLGFADAIENYQKGDKVAAAKDAAFALPIGLLSNWKTLTKGAKMAYKSMLSPAALKALMAWEASGAIDDIRQSTENDEMDNYIK